MQCMCSDGSHISPALCHFKISHRYTCIRPKLYVDSDWRDVDGRIHATTITTTAAEMSMLVDYGSSDDEAGPSSAPVSAVPLASRVVAAPDVSLEVS